MTTRDSESEFTGVLASGERLASRFLLDDPTKGWRPISVKRFLAAQKGELLLPDLANSTIRVACADMATRNGKPVALASLTLSEWRLDDEGRVDQAALMAGILKKLDGLQRKHKEKHLQPSAADFDAICKAVGVPRG